MGLLDSDAAGLLYMLLVILSKRDIASQPLPRRRVAF